MYTSELYTKLLIESIKYEFVIFVLSRRVNCLLYNIQSNQICDSVVYNNGGNTQTSEKVLKKFLTNVNLTKYWY